MRLFRNQLFYLTLCLACGTGCTARSEHTYVLPMNQGSVTIHPDSPQSPIEISYSDCTFRPLNDFGPELLIDGKPVGPSDHSFKLFRSSMATNQQKVYLAYQNVIDTNLFYWMTISTVGPHVFIDVELRDPVATAVRSGHVEHAADYKPFTMTPRMRESWEQNTTTPALWNRDGKFWLYGEWLLEDSNSSGPNFARMEWGKDVAPAVEYSPYAFGQRRAVRERFKLGINRDLWVAVGPVANPPSEYKEELAGMMFLDLWGGSSTQKTDFLEQLVDQSANTLKFYTVIQTWQKDGFDKTNPDAFWPPNVLPGNPYGTQDELQGLVDTARANGRVALRTNYLLINNSPSAREGLIRGRVTEAAPEAGVLMGDEHRHFNQNSIPDWARLARFQETDIHEYFRTNAQFVDQVGSLGGAGYIQDKSPHYLGAGVARYNAQVMKDFCRLIKETHQGPMSSETLNGEHLLGRWLDTGDYGIFNGYNRLLSPAYKLHRLHGLTTFHGMGLGYRFFGYPQNFANGNDWLGSGHAMYFGIPGYDFYAGSDAYRAMEVLFGNGAYFYAYPSTPVFARAHKEHVFTEMMTVGVLQRYYALQNVSSILYRWKDEWMTLNELMNDPDIQFKPNQDDCPAFSCIKITYDNGLSVWVNREEKELSLNIQKDTYILPKNSYLACTPDLSILTYSAIGPLASHRVDYCQDKNRSITFLNPRGKSVDGIQEAKLWLTAEKEIPK